MTTWLPHAIYPESVRGDLGRTVWRCGTCRRRIHLRRSARRGANGWAHNPRPRR